MSEISIKIEELNNSPHIRQALGEMLVEVVADGGSVSFMHPLSMSDAEDFWARSLIAASRGERVILGAFERDALIGTVTLLLDVPPNQPHRAEIAKMMTRVNHRGRGVARSLLREAERIATQRGRTLLVLDTAAEEGASGFYEKQGYTLSGLIPDFAYKPHGGLTATMIYWKWIGEKDEARVPESPRSE
jgi:ribosomal protein S18 acetylase RimI-like enzyme